ncbi:MAG: hypothetical protein JWP76_3177 [Dactylosporangium sp.]|nr:hypothetical protein [Dactylosporangium sp.]
MSEVPRSLPGFAAWPTFPFEGDLRVKQLDDPVLLEPPRHGDDPSECRACSAPDEAYIWVSERWRVRSLDRPTGLPMVLILESRSHLDLGDLPNMLAAELGVMTVRLERAVRSLDGVARVHVNRWGDGSAHLHLWFLARPYGYLQLRGTFLSLWDEILPPIPEHQWRESLAHVAAWLAEFGGRPLAEPPRIDWKAPATLAPAASSFLAEDGAESNATEDWSTTTGLEAAGTANGGGDIAATEAGDAVTPAGAAAAAGEWPTPTGRAEDGTTGTAGTSESNGTDDATAQELPDEFATARDILVTPGPSGFSSIVEAPVQDGGHDENAVRLVPGQREGSAQDRDSSAAAPA